MPFMIPRADYGPFIRWEHYGESFWVPQDVEDLIEAPITARATAWFAQFSAPGYLDATEYIGPYKTEADAFYELFEFYDSTEITWEAWIRKYDLSYELIPMEEDLAARCGDLSNQADYEELEEQES